jgi:putative ATP-binding cassette transporter
MVCVGQALLAVGWISRLRVNSMDSSQPAPFNRQTIRRFFRAIKDLLTSEVRHWALGLVALLVVFALSVNGLNVVNSYVGRDFMTDIARRDMAGFVRLGIYYILVFAATTAIAVLYRFTEERLGLLWRNWLTRRVTEAYLAQRNYFRLKESAAIDNPDQRIADDVRVFTTTTLSFMLIFLNAILAAISFSGVLCAISPLLFAVAVGYAAIGTLVSFYLGRPLLGLNYRQSDCEANFRANLIHVRENAESIAILRQEDRLKARLLRRIDDLIANFRRITSVNRNLGFFTTGYNYLIQIIPTLIIAPSFIRGEIEFGTITQSGMAFAQLLGAFSVIINQFGSISSFAAVVARLGELAEAVEATQNDVPAIETVENPNGIHFDRLTLCSQDGAVLLSDLSMSVPRGMRVLVTGPNEAARIALFRAVAGIRSPGHGLIERPPLDNIMFLPQKSYLAPGTLRDVIVRSDHDVETTDEQITIALRRAGLGPLLDRVGGLNVELDWSTKLSLTEQQQLAFTRVMLARPMFALLDRIGTTLGPTLLRQYLHSLADNAISTITFDDSVELSELHDAVLDISEDGRWAFRKVIDNDSALDQKSAVNSG